VALDDEAASVRLLLRHFFDSDRRNRDEREAVALVIQFG
jgi:hypothetical protein